MRSSFHRRPRLRLERLEARLAPTFGPIGPEFRVNSVSAGNQGQSQLAVDADGDFVIAWASNSQDGSGYGVYAQRYSAGGVPQGPEFRVNTFTSNAQSIPVIGMNAAGDFVIAWQSNGQDGSDYGVYAQRYSAAGASLGGEFRVNTYTTGIQYFPAVAMNATGDFVVTWMSQSQEGDIFSGYGIYAQRYSAAGTPAGGEFRVNTFTTRSQVFPAVAMDAAGDFVVTWQSYNQASATSENDIYAQRYSATGLLLGGEFRVNTYSLAWQFFPAVGMDGAGNFVAAWASDIQDGLSDGVYAQRYSASGEPLGIEFRVNSYTTGSQQSPAVAADAAGSFVVAWSSFGQDGSDYGVYSQRYNSAGVAQGGEFPVNTFTPGSQSVPKVASDADGDFVIAWGSDGQDGDQEGVYAQRYTDLDDNGDTAGPIVTTVRPPGASQPIAAGGVVVSTPSQLVVTFSEAMAVSGAGSVMSTANWQLARYGAVVPGFITGITIGLNAATNQYEAVLSFAAPLADGRYTLTALPTMTDAAGNALDGNRDGTPGDSFSLTFDVKPVTPRGPETQVNTYTTGSQSFPRVAVDTTGNTVVVWSSTIQDGSSYGVYARRYNAAGASLGSEFRVNTFTTGAQWNPAVAMNPAGDFVVVWMSGGQDGSSYGVYAQRYSADGTPQGAEFRVNEFTTSFQHLPVVAMNAAGDFVIAWSSVSQDGDGSGIYGRRYNAAGTALSSEFRVNTYTTSNQTAPSIGMSATGDFVVAWDSEGQEGSTLGVYAQRFSATGVRLGGEFRANTFTTGLQGEPAVGVGAAGDFVITWIDENPVDGPDISAQRYSAGGTPIGGEFLVNVTTTGSQVYPSVAVGADGGFVISWQNDVGVSDIDARRFDAAGTPITGEFHVSTYSTGEQSFPSVATDAQGDIVVVWASGVPVGVGQDGDRYGVYTQRFAANLTPTTIGLPNIIIPANPTSDVNLAAGFNDIEDGAAGLTYNVVGNTNPAAFISLVIIGSTLTIWPGLPGASTLTIRATDSGGAFVETSFTVTIAGAAPQVAQTLVNGSTGAQRSRVTSLELTFSNQVTFAGAVASAFALSRNGGSAVAFTATANIVGGRTVVTLNAFTGAEIESGSLRDGRYTLTAFASQITVGGLQLDGDGNGNGGDDYTFGDSQGLFRFYGDMNADRRIDISDFGFFSLAYLTSANFNPALDFNSDGRIDISDFGQFSVRFFTTLP